MKTRGVIVCVLGLVGLGGVALAQDDAPIVNWSAPPYWAAAGAGKENMPGGRIQVSGEGVGPITAQAALPSSPVPFTAITPCRVVDTRHDGGVYGDAETRTYHFDTTVYYTGTGACSLIPLAAALSLSVQFQVTNHNASLIAYPDDVTRPTVASVIAYNTGLFYINSAIVPTGADNGIDVYAQYGGQVVININGYYAPTNFATTPNPLKIAMLMWYNAADIPAHFTAGGDINYPSALAFDGAHIWVANYNGNSVTELNASDGGKVGTFNAGGDIAYPNALAFDGAHIWVANVNGNSVTELNASNGSKVGTFNAGGDIKIPWALAFDGAHVWVANLTGNSVTELDASIGSKVGTFIAGSDINGPEALAFDGAHIWVANANGNSVTELNASDGSKIGTFTAGGDILGPVALAFDGAHIWVANANGNSVTELNASNGSKVGTFTAGGELNRPKGLAFDGAHVWVANNSGYTVTELNASDGSWVGTFTAGGDISFPSALAFDGAHIWVANPGSLDKL